MRRDACASCRAALRAGAARAHRRGAPASATRRRAQRRRRAPRTGAATGAARAPCGSGGEHGAAATPTAVGDLRATRPLRAVDLATALEPSREADDPGRVAAARAGPGRHRSTADSARCSRRGGSRPRSSACTRCARGARARAAAAWPTGDDPRRARLVGLALAARDGPRCYVPLGHDGGSQPARQVAGLARRRLLADPSVPKVGEDLKRDAHVLAAPGCRSRGLRLRPARRLVPVRSRARPRARGAGARLPRRRSACAAVGAAAARRPRATRPRCPPRRGRAPEARARPRCRSAGRRAARPARGARAVGPLQQLEHPLIPVLLEMERAGVARRRRGARAR